MFDIVFILSFLLPMPNTCTIRMQLDSIACLHSGVRSDQSRRIKQGISDGSIQVFLFHCFLRVSKVIVSIFGYLVFRYW